MNTARCTNREKLASQYYITTEHGEAACGHPVLITREEEEAGLLGPQPADRVCPRTLPGTQFSTFAACIITMRLRNHPIKRVTKQLAGYKHKVNPSGGLNPHPNIAMELRSTSMPPYDWPVAQYMYIKWQVWFLLALFCHTRVNRLFTKLRRWLSWGKAIHKWMDCYETASRGEGSASCLL
jgi:hypothetical protein